MSEHSKDHARRRPKNGPERVRSDIGPWAMVPRWVMRRCSPGELMVYMELSLRADRDTNECWPSHRTIAEDTGMSYATVRRHLDSLRSKGCIDWDQRDRKDGGQTSNVYTVFYVEHPPLTSERPPLLTGERPPCSGVSDLEPEPLDQSQKNQNQFVAPAAQRNEEDFDMSLPLGASLDAPVKDDYFDERQQRRPKREPGVKPERPQRKSKLDIEVEYFRDKTIDALSRRGLNKLLLMAFDRGALRRCFKLLLDDHSLTYAQIHALVDQWAIDIEVKRYTPKDGTPAWKLFLSQLSAIQQRIDDKASSGEEAVASSSLWAELEAKTLAWIEES